MRFPKHQYIRSSDLLRNAREIPCQHCGADDGTVVAAHTNWQGGKGRGIKADDNLTAALCASCHYDIDQGAQWSKKERQQAFYVAHMKTVQHLVDSDQWPVDVPIPNDAEWERLFEPLP
jgi:hypothetical protein